MRVARLFAAVALIAGAFAAAAAPGSFSITSSGVRCSNGAPVNFMVWSASSGATSYVVIRDDVQVFGPTTALNFDDTNVVTGNQYSYFVRASDGASTTPSRSKRRRVFRRARSR